MHTHILQTRSRAFFFSVVITVVTINTSITFNQSVSFTFFFASSHRAPAFSALTAIKQSKPYTATTFTVQFGVLQFFFTVSIILFHLLFVFTFPLLSESGMGMTVIWYMYLRDKASELDIIILIPKGYPGRPYPPDLFFCCPETVLYPGGPLMRPALCVARHHRGIIIQFKFDWGTTAISHCNVISVPSHPIALQHDICQSCFRYS